MAKLSDPPLSILADSNSIVVQCLQKTSFIGFTLQEIPCSSNVTLSSVEKYYKNWGLSEQTISLSKSEIEILEQSVNAFKFNNSDIRKTQL